MLVENLLNILKQFTNLEKEIVSNILYRKELDKVCFPHHIAYSDRKDLTKRTISGKILKDRAYEIASNHKYDGYQRTFATFNKKLFITFLIRKQY